MSMSFSRSALLSFRQATSLFFASTFGPSLLFSIVWLSATQAQSVFLVTLILTLLLLPFPIKRDFIKTLLNFSLFVVLLGLFLSFLASHREFLDSALNYSFDKAGYAFFIGLVIYLSAGISFVPILTLMALTYFRYVPLSFAFVAVVSFFFARSLVGLLEARKGNINSQRSAVLALLSNLFFGVLFLVFFEKSFSSFLEASSFSWAFIVPGLSLFYTLLLFSFSIFLIKAMELLEISFFSSRKRPQKTMTPLFRSHFSPFWALEQAQQEVKRASANISNLLNFNLSILTDEQEKEVEKKTKKYEKIISNMKVEFSKFISGIIRQKLSTSQSEKLKGLILIAEGLESLSGHCFEFSHSHFSLKHMNVSLGKELHAALEGAQKKIVHYYESSFVSLLGQEGLPQGERSRREQQFLEQHEFLKQQVFLAVSKNALGKEATTHLQKMTVSLEQVQSLSKKILKIYTTHCQ